MGQSPGPRRPGGGGDRCRAGFLHPGLEAGEEHLGPLDEEGRGRAPLTWTMLWNCYQGHNWLWLFGASGQDLFTLRAL